MNMDIAYESFVHDVCMEAISKEGTTAKRNKLIKEVDTQTGLSKNIKNMKSGLNKIIAKGDKEKAILIVNNCAKSCREYARIMSQRMSEFKKIKANDSPNSLFGKALKISIDKGAVSKEKAHIKEVEHIEKYWCPLILKELRTNGCSDKATSMVSQFSKGVNKFKE